MLKPLEHMLGPSEALRQVAFNVADAFGAAPPSEVQRLRSAPGDVFIDVFRYDHHPVPGVSSYSTVGLSSHPLMDGAREFPGRVELCGAARGKQVPFANLLAAVAFEVISGAFVFPDRIFPGIVSRYFPDSAMRHLVVMTPFLWDDRLRQFDAGGRTVAWLQVVPISDGELALARRGSVADMIDFLEQREVDVTDLGRRSEA